MSSSIRSVALACLLSGAAAAAGAGGITTRAPSAQESASFQAFYQKQYPTAAAVKPLFAITRAHPRAPWTVRASVDGPPRRGLRTLCRIDRSEFVFDKRWSAAERVRQFVWLQNGACGAGQDAAELLQRMPDADVLVLLQNQAAALPKARLIMAGNSGCAPLRSFPFRFAAIDVGPSGSGNEEMAGLVYRSGAEAQVTVWVRKSAGGIDNWNVSCPPRANRPEQPAS